MPEETWEGSSKDMVATAVAWMADECARQGRKWNTMSDNDLIVSQGYERIEAEAMARGIPVDAVDVTHGELLDAMRVMVRGKRADAKKKATPASASSVAPATKAS